MRERHWWSGAVAVAALCAALVQVGCDDQPEDMSASADAEPPNGTKQEPHDVGTPHSRADIYSQDAQLSSGAQNVTLLSIRRMGRLIVSCDADGTASANFKADRLLATADVVVASVGGKRSEGILQPRNTFRGPPLRSPDVQIWSIAEFAPAGVRPTMITLASHAVDGGGALYRCAVSAQATVGESTTTITR